MSNVAARRQPSGESAKNNFQLLLEKDGSRPAVYNSDVTLVRALPLPCPHHIYFCANPYILSTALMQKGRFSYGKTDLLNALLGWFRRTDES